MVHRHPIIYLFALVLVSILALIGNLISQYLESRRVKKYYKTFYSVTIKVRADECEYILRNENGEKVFRFSELLNFTDDEMSSYTHFRIRCEREVEKKQFVFLSDWEPLSDAVLPFKEKYEPMTVLLNPGKGEYFFDIEKFLA